MTLVRLLFITPFILMMTSCVAMSTANMEKTEALAQDEGILLIRTKGEGVDAGKIQIHDIAGSGFSLSVVSLSIKSEEQILILKLKAGPTYGFTRYATYGGGIELEKGKYTFTIEPGKINYVGDIHVKQEGWTVKMTFDVNESRAVAKAKQAQPWLFKKYPYTLSALQFNN